MRLIGLCLIAAGAVALSYQGLAHYAGQGLPRLPHFGGESERSVYWPPVAGGIALVAGLALLANPRREHL